MFSRPLSGVSTLMVGDCDGDGDGDGDWDWEWNWDWDCLGEGRGWRLFFCLRVCAQVEAKRDNFL